MANGKQGITKGTASVGTTHNVATYEITETDARQIQRVNINDQFGNDLVTASSQTAPSALVLSTAGLGYKVVASGAKVGWLLHNISDTEVYMGFHSTVRASGELQGIRLFPGGGYEQRGMGVFTGDVYVVSPSATKVVCRQTW